jgi:D-glycero-alpha-D-manno-heptose-7-phosphate kinase
VLIARAPLRIGLAGGGTDLPAYSDRYGGLVVSATIDKHVYVILSAGGGRHIQVSSSDYRSFFRSAVGEPASAEGELKLPKAVLGRFGIRSGVSILLASQVPPGTGLGSSSAVAVALIKALAELCGRRLAVREVAELACEIEIDELGMPIGKQDQYAAAFGGLRCYEFTPGGVKVERLDVPGSALAALEARLMLFFTPTRHDSATILAEQRRNTTTGAGGAIEALHEIRELAAETRADLLAGDVSRVGARLHRSWLAKRRLASGISDPRIDEWYEIARAAGADGGKIAGAGGGGFLLLHCEPDRQDHVIDALRPRGLVRMDFRVESGGAMVIVNHLAGALPARDAIAVAAGA